MEPSLVYVQSPNTCHKAALHFPIVLHGDLYVYLNFYCFISSDLFCCDRGINKKKSEKIKGDVFMHAVHFSPACHVCSFSCWSTDMFSSLSLASLCTVLITLNISTLWLCCGGELLLKMLEQSSRPVAQPLFQVYSLAAFSQPPSYRCYLVCVTLGHEIAELCVCVVFVQLYTCVSIQLGPYILGHQHNCHHFGSVHHHHSGLEMKQSRCALRE